MFKKNNSPSLRCKLVQIFNGNHPRLGNSFDIFITVLILISLIALTVETIPDLPSWLRQFLYILEIIIVSLFTVEYISRILAARPHSNYVFSFWGCVDVLAIAPFYFGLLGLGLDLRAIRVLRLLRVLRAFKLFRHAKAADRLKNAFQSVKDELTVFAGMACMLLYLSAVGIYFCENEVQPEIFSSIPGSLWWAVVTLTTVGYGDAFPVTVGGRVFTFFILVLGLGIIAIPTGLIASALTNMHESSKED